MLDDLDDLFLTNYVYIYSLCARTMFFFSTGLLLQSLWTLLRYFKPKVGAYVQYEPKDPPVGIARSPRLKLKLFVFAQSNGSLSAAAAVALARQVSLRRWWRHRFALHRRRHRHQHAKHTHIHSTTQTIHTRAKFGPHLLKSTTTQIQVCVRDFETDVLTEIGRIWTMAHFSCFRCTRFNFD